MKRNSNIELYRCLIMFGIVFLHCAYNSIGSCSWENKIFKWCVDGFVLITGYFGTKFSLKKVVRLYGMVIVCEIVTRLASAFFMGDGFAPLHIARQCWEGLLSVWFVHAYVLMLCIAPLINATLEYKDGLKYIIPFVTLVTLWGLVGEMPFIWRAFPKTAGIGSFSGLTLAAVYAVGRIVRIKQFENRYKTWQLLAVLPLLLLIDIFSIPYHGKWIYGGLGNYASPFAIATAFVTFSLLLRVRLPNSVGKVILLVSPSMFPVYLMHWNDYTYHLMHDVGLRLMNNYSVFIVCLCLAIIIYVGTIILDLPRRIIAKAMFKRG